MLFGIEIECYAPKDSLPVVYKTGYHRGSFEKNDYWKFESDSSLSSYYSGRESVEIISKLLVDREDLSVAMENFRKIFKMYTRFPIVIDETCGCHLHIGDNDWTNVLPYAVLEKIEKGYRKWLYGYDKKQSFAFKKHYYRKTYSRPNKSYDDYTKRSSAFYKSDRGLEWRAFNLAGVKSFEDVEARIIKAYEMLEEVYENGRTTKLSFEYPKRWFKSKIKESQQKITNMIGLLEQELKFKTPLSAKKIEKRLYDNIYIVSNGLLDEMAILPFSLRDVSILEELTYKLPSAPERTEIYFAAPRKSKRIYKTKYYKIIEED